MPDWHEPLHHTSRLIFSSRWSPCISCCSLDKKQSFSVCHPVSSEWTRSLGWAVPSWCQTCPMTWTWTKCWCVRGQRRREGFLLSMLFVSPPVDQHRESLLHLLHAKNMFGGPPSAAGAGIVGATAFSFDPALANPLAGQVPFRGGMPATSMPGMAGGMPAMVTGFNGLGGLPAGMPGGLQGGLPGGMPGSLQGGLSYGAAPQANLFSSIVLPEPVQPPSNDSADSNGAGGTGADAEAGDGKGTRGGARTQKTADQRQTAIQEKNRRAQKRFRERQKAKMRDMGEQLDEMSGELSRLRVENNSLKNRNSILEKASGRKMIQKRTE